MSLEYNLCNMGKDSYWFRHDSTAGRGLRMRKIAHIYSHWGKGVYWDVIEILREQEHYCHPKDESSLQMLASLIGCQDVTKFVNWYKDCVKIDLLQEDEKSFFSVVLRQNMGKWETKKRNGSEPKSETEAKPQAKRKHKIRLDKRTKKKKREVILFSSSPFFDKVKFAEALPEWSKDKLKYYYESALTWSNEGNSKKDWIATVKTWAARDEKEGKLKFTNDVVQGKEITGEEFYGSMV